MLARAGNRQICDANACYSRVFFSYEVLNEVLNEVLYLSEHSDQLDVTLESSKIVKLAAHWLSPGFGRPKAMLSNEDHGIYSDFFLLSSNMSLLPHSLCLSSKVSIFFRLPRSSFFLDLLSSLYCIVESICALFKFGHVLDGLKKI